MFLPVYALYIVMKKERGKKNMHFAQRLQQALIDVTVDQLWSRMSSIEDLTVVCQHRHCERDCCCVIRWIYFLYCFHFLILCYAHQAREFAVFTLCFLCSLCGKEEVPQQHQLCSLKASAKNELFSQLYITLSTSVTIFIYNGKTLKDMHIFMAHVKSKIPPLQHT